MISRGMDVSHSKKPATPDGTNSRRTRIDSVRSGPRSASKLPKQPSPKEDQVVLAELLQNRHELPNGCELLV